MSLTEKERAPIPQPESQDWSREQAFVVLLFSWCKNSGCIKGRKLTRNSFVVPAAGKRCAGDHRADRD